MGAAANALAAIRAYEETPNPRARLTLVSFETDLDSLRLAMQHPDKFAYLRHGAPHAILQKGEWESKKHPIRWVLYPDFFAHLEQAPAPAIIYFDPFSAKTNYPFWCMENLKRVRARAEAFPGGAELFTYSASTAVRASLLAAGFFVARGAPTGPKGETTIACTEKATPWRQGQLLGQEWLERWERSDARWPLLLSEKPDDETLHLVRSHRQFSPALTAD
jgi:queuine tRNA-ribosyltransferase